MMTHRLAKLSLHNNVYVCAISAVSADDSDPCDNNTGYEMQFSKMGEIRHCTLLSQ